MIWLRRIRGRHQVYRRSHQRHFCGFQSGGFLKDWALDSSRKPGDTDVVDSTYGSHVMYFVGTGLPVWKAAVVNTLRSDDVDEWTNSLVEGADVSQSDFGMKFVG